MGSWFSSNSSFPITVRNNNYGWVRDLPDNRDVIENTSSKSRVHDIDLRNELKFPSMSNQNTIKSSSSQTISSALYCTLQNNDPTINFIPSSIFIYFNQRVITNSTELDSGASIRDGLKIIKKIGCCSENDCKYDISRFNQRPSVKAYMNAESIKTKLGDLGWEICYKKLIPTFENILTSLNNHTPIIFGFSVFESFELQDGVKVTGRLKIPSKNEKLLGGHTGLCVGYDSSTDFFIIKNSFGDEWGDKGYFYMPREFILDSNFCDDFWILTLNNVKNTDSSIIDNSLISEEEKEIPKDLISEEEKGGLRPPSEGRERPSLNENIEKDCLINFQ